MSPETGRWFRVKSSPCRMGCCGSGRRRDEGTKRRRFTAAFTGALVKAGTAIGMDGVGRVFDNMMVERVLRTVKYEDVYLRDYETPAEARLGLVLESSASPSQCGPADAGEHVAAR